MKKIFEHKKIVVTGGAGTIGSELVFQIQELNPKQIIVLDNSEYGIHKLLHNSRYNKKISKVILIDIKNTTHTNSVLSEEKPNIIIHAAAYKHLSILQSYPSEAILTNVMATKNLVNLSKEIEVDRFLFVSTDKSVCPTSNLGVSKFLAESIIKSQIVSTTKFYIVRFGNIYRSSGSVVEIFEQQIKNNKPLTLTDLDVSRFFIDLQKACLLLLKTLSISVNKGVFIFDMGNPKKVLDVAKDIVTENNLELYSDINIDVTGLRKGEKLTEILFTKDDVLKRTIHNEILEVIEKSNSCEYNKVVDDIINLAKNRNDLKLSQEINEIIKNLK